MSAVDTAVWWVGAVTIALVGGSGLVLAAYLLLETVWRLVRVFPFAARVIKLGMRAEAARLKEANREILG